MGRRERIENKLKRAQPYFTVIFVISFQVQRQKREELITCHASSKFQIFLWNLLL